MLCDILLYLYFHHVAAKAAVGSCSIVVDVVDSSSSNASYYKKPTPEDVEMFVCEGEQCKCRSINNILHSRNREWLHLIH